MAANIFNTADAQAIRQRLALLQADSPRQWGTMTVPEMCWHCRQQLEFVLQPADTAVLKTIYRFQPFKWLAIFGVPWPKEAPTAPQMDARRSQPAVGDVAAERQALLAALEQVLQLPDISALHPLFGRLGKHYWGRLIWKHLDHHLRQFNC